jgi:Arm DNA-binding domain
MNSDLYLSTALMQSLEAPDSGNRITLERGPDAVRGFGARITAAGVRAFVLNYSIGGRERRYTIGTYPAWSVAAARTEAKRLRRQVDRGFDPLSDREQRRTAKLVARASRQRTEPPLSEPEAILEAVTALRAQLTPENCYRLADEVVSALEQARTAAAADNTPENRAALIRAHTRAHALVLAMTPAMIATDEVKFSLLAAACDRLDQIPLWQDIPGESI